MDEGQGGLGHYDVNRRSHSRHSSGRISTHQWIPDRQPHRFDARRGGKLTDSGGRGKVLAIFRRLPWRIRWDAYSNCGPIRFGTWRLCDRHSVHDQRIATTRWVFDIKRSTDGRVERFSKKRGVCRKRKTARILQCKILQVHQSLYGRPDHKYSL